MIVLLSAFISSCCLKQKSVKRDYCFSKSALLSVIKTISSAEEKPGIFKLSQLTPNLLSSVNSKLLNIHCRKDGG